MAINKIKFGTTNFEDLYQFFYDNEEKLYSRKSRLFPNGNTNNETSTTSIFLASLSAVKEYREELFSQIGSDEVKRAIKLKTVEVHTYTELSDDTTGDTPDGLIVITSGKKPIIEWACFVESKVDNNSIKEAQIERYINFARKIGINSIITISNHLVTSPKDSHIKTSKRAFKLYHWSWTYLKITALRLANIIGCDDEDHQYILQELGRYFDNHTNINDFDNMGQDWKDSVDKIRNYSPKQKINQKLLNNIVNSYKQEEKDISLQLTGNTKFYVELYTKKKNRTKEIEKMLQSSKTIQTDFIIDGNKDNLFSIKVDFIRQTITCYTYITINKGKHVGQTSTLIKMFEDIGATEHMIVKAIYKYNKYLDKNTSLDDLIKEKKLSKHYSILNNEFGDHVKYFEIKTEVPQDFKSVKKFIGVLEHNAKRFLEQIMANKKI